MPAQPVEAVFVVFYGLAAHKATYGRDVADNTYTKDYIQLIQDSAFRETLERLFPRAGAGQRTEIDYRWPGGSRRGSIEFESADRPHLAWSTREGAPLPWRMTPSPAAAGPQTIPGDPTAIDPGAAGAEFNALAAAGTQPYLVAIKLRDEPNVLHVRAYLENPPPSLAFADTTLLPPAVQTMVTKATRTRAFQWALFDSKAALMTPEIAAAVERLEENPALLLVGPPGTGKTVLLESLAEFVTNPGSGVLFDPDENHDAWADATSAGVPGMARTVVLHPSYSYDNLVVGLLPEPTDKGGVGIRVSTGPLVNLAHYASQDGRRALLVLDEFNRANAAAVLGDTLALLDKDKRGKAFIDLPYGDLDITVPAEFAANGGTTVDPHFTLPPNLWVVAAMNTSDRSVAPLDAALRRRFTIVEMGPDYDLLTLRLGADEDANLGDPVDAWTIGHVGRLAVELLRAINARIDAVLGIDFRLGHSNFWHVCSDGRTVDAAVLALASAFDHRVVASLRLTLQDDDSALAAILRAGTPDQPAAGTTAAWWQRPDAELGAFASDRLHLREVSALQDSDALQELRRQARL